MTTDKREAARTLCQFGLSILHVCQVADLSRASFYRQPRDWRIADAAVIDALNEQLKKSPQAAFGNTMTDYGVKDTRSTTNVFSASIVTWV